jgi:osmotically inducible protein OsmC
MQLDKVIYTGKTITTGGRDGSAHSDDGRLNVQLSGPGSNGPGTNPEQLLGAGWSACFIGAMKKAGVVQSVTLPADLSVNAEIDLGTIGEGYALQARLNISLPGLEPEVASKIVEMAHNTCPYSKALKSGINIELKLI